MGTEPQFSTEVLYDTPIYYVLEWLVECVPQTFRILKTSRKTVAGSLERRRCLESSGKGH